MVATFAWVEYTDTNVSDTPTNLNLGSTNAINLVPSTYPITAGTRSYSKWVAGEWSGSFTRIENLKFWMSASGSGYVTGETLWFSGTESGYAGTDSNAAVNPTTASDTFAAHAIVTDTPSGANIGIGGSLTGSLTATGKSDFVVIQASITDTASPGPVQQKTFTLMYDEV